MPSAFSSTERRHSPEQAQLWVRGLLRLAWADGHYDPEEQELIESLLHDDLELTPAGTKLETISPEELAAQLDPQEAEDFLRVAVMVAVADGVYSEPEDQLLHTFSQALKVEIPGFDHLRSTLVSQSTASSRIQPEGASQTPTSQAVASQVATSQAPSGLMPLPEHHDVLDPLRHWLDGVDVHNRRVAHFLCKLIPPQCPFERDVVVFNRKVFHIPAMCKLNPLYDQVVGIRFRALSYLADECKEDVRQYF